MTDCVANHVNDECIDKARIPLVENARKPFRVTPEKISPHAQKAMSQEEYVLL